ncbi:MAG: peptidoglycan-binding domain-containing protein [Candidatus Contendobacter sp.]|nr:peptidoglycan-binding domain-containing protein [Candidatus Contendobacter sp.]
MITSDLFSGDAQIMKAATNAPPLQMGATGSGVKLLQLALIALGAQMPSSTQAGQSAPDGIFGRETRAAVIAFQAANGLAQDGIVGRMTIAALDAKIRPIQATLQAQARTNLYNAVRRFRFGTGPAGNPVARQAMEKALQELVSLIGSDAGGAGRSLEHMLRGR